jgi:hypothetical protein
MKFPPGGRLLFPALSVMCGEAAAPHQTLGTRRDWLNVQPASVYFI